MIKCPTYHLDCHLVLTRSSISSKSHEIHNTSSAMAVSGAPMPDRFLRADGKALAKEAPPAPGAPKLKVDAGFGVGFWQGRGVII